MSTHRHSLRGYRNTCVPLFLACCGLLLALQPWVASSSVVSASAAHTMAATSTPQANQGFDRAKGTVVRLRVSYVDPTDSNKAIPVCTGLGVLVKSSPASGGGAASTSSDNWVLTDGSLVHPAQATCAGPPVAAGTLSKIEIRFNNTFAGKNSLVKVDGTSTPEVRTSIICSDDANCSNGPALVPFRGEPVSSVDVASSGEGTFAIALTDASKKLPNPGEVIAGETDFLTPQSLDKKTPGLEVGTPLVDAGGHLTGLHSAKPEPINREAIATLIARIPNDTQQKVNPSPTATPFPPDTLVVVPGINFPLGLWQIMTLILLFLALVGLIVALVIRSRRGRTNRLSKAEWEEAERHAVVEAREIETMEAARRSWEEHQVTADQPTIPVKPALQEKTVLRKTATDLHCPRCGALVVHDARYCPKCSLLLSPSESGLHMRVRPTSSSVPAQSSVPARPFADTNPRAVPPPTPAPTFPANSLADQPTIPPLPVPMSPIDEMMEQPTIEITPSVTRKITGSIYDDNTIPSSLRPVQGKRLGFVVGTNSNPGIKRKYKPNEDSLFAAQGLIGRAPGPQPFGLFVIADGMGGHANGQDASRLAIQMIVENVLPKLVNDSVGSIDYVEVLADGIQSANQAVHQQNMEKRGDMGTTVTSALVVGPVAYVANVGDSRTYLYREAEGLRKVTNDHSVVASLVEAGIIKPDDIYTHPKRNQIYRSLGEKANVEIDKFTVQLHEGDKLLLCSDGLWDMVRDPKIEEVIGRPVPNPSITGDDLVQSALEGGGEDNVSVIVVQITEGGNPEALPRVQLLAKPESLQMPQF